MEGYIYIIIIFAVFIFFVYQSWAGKRNMMARLKKKIKNQWGNVSDREYEQKEYDKISSYYEKALKNNSDVSEIDDITWNDLDMDTIFKKMNTTLSSAGEEYLYRMLRIPEQTLDVLQERDRIISYFEQHSEEAWKLEEIYCELGRTKNISLTDFVDRINELPEKSNLVHYILDVLFGASIVTLFIRPVAGILFFVLMICVNVFFYYKRKAEVESYFVCFRYLVAMQSAAELIGKEKVSVIEKYTDNLSDICKKLVAIRKGIFLLAPRNLNGSVGEVVMEYVRMITHVDLIKFNSMLKLTKEHQKEIDELFTNLGLIEALIAVASYRKSLEYYTRPTMTSDKKRGLRCEAIYHPLITNPVCNDIYESVPVLLTGSNASGKSTFLKTIAVNAIFAQTIYTCTAKEYESCFYSIYSSMALRDNLQGQESYYIVEIKSLKRILDKISEGKNVLCFVDEVLRGTNTVERIAASAYILNYLNNSGAMCFAATHDVELTHILDGIYSNYHFQEEVSENDVLFNYELQKGRASSRNAIKLLGVIGYDKNIIEKAENAAEQFLNTGVWKNIEQNI